MDGTAKVTNVKVTTDEREVVRRALFTEKMKSRFDSTSHISQQPITFSVGCQSPGKQAMATVAEELKLL